MSIYIRLDHPIRRFIYTLNPNYMVFREQVARIPVPPSRLWTSRGGYNLDRKTEWRMQSHSSRWTVTSITVSIGTHTSFAIMPSPSWTYNNFSSIPRSVPVAVVSLLLPTCQCLTVIFFPHQFLGNRVLSHDYHTI